MGITESYGTARYDTVRARGGREKDGGGRGEAGAEMKVGWRLVKRQASGNSCNLYFDISYNSCSLQSFYSFWKKKNKES